MIFIGHAPYATCQTGADIKALKTKLFDTNGYDKRMRPTYNPSEAIVITAYLHPLAINEVDEAKQTMKTTACIHLIWKDAFLKWDPADHHKINDAFWPQDEVWKPDVALTNSNLEYKELGLPSLNVRNWADGTVFWCPIQVFESTCAIDITNFPFDYQTSYLKFKPWSYGKTEVEMKRESNGFNLKKYRPNSG